MKITYYYYYAQEGKDHRNGIGILMKKSANASLIVFGQFRTVL